MFTFPELYFWLMGQIMFYYVAFAVIVCFVIRKFCQHPDKLQQIEKEDYFAYTQSQVKIPERFAQIKTPEP
jgi:Ca2+/Na+ antiporter